MRSENLTRRCVPTLWKGSSPFPRRLTRNGRETFKRSAASCVVSSAWCGMRVTALPRASSVNNAWVAYSPSLRGPFLAALRTIAGADNDCGLPPARNRMTTLRMADRVVRHPSMRGEGHPLLRHSLAKCGCGLPSQLCEKAGEIGSVAESQVVGCLGDGHIGVREGPLGLEQNPLLDHS